MPRQILESMGMKYDRAQNKGEIGIDELKQKYESYKTRLGILKNRINGLLELKDLELKTANKAKISMSNSVENSLDKAKEAISRGGADSLKKLAYFHDNMDRLSSVRSRIIELEGKIQKLFDPANMNNSLYNLLQEEFDSDIERMEGIANFMEMDMGYGHSQFVQFDVNDLAAVHAGYDIVENHNEELRAKEGNVREDDVSLESLTGEKLSNEEMRLLSNMPRITGRHVILSNKKGQDEVDM